MVVGWTTLESQRLGLIFTEDTPYPMNAFYSNRAYEAPGFCTITLEAEPFQGDDPRQRLMDYIDKVESDRYHAGRHSVVPIDPITDPQEIGSSASTIEHHSYHLPVTPVHHLPGNLMAATTVALVRFSGRTDIFVRACNLETENLDYRKILGSIQFDGEAVTPGFSVPYADAGMAALFREMSAMAA
jgi:hypothetical protein